MTTYLGKQFIVHQLDPRQKWILDDVAVIVVREYTTLDTTQHIRADCWKMHVTAAFAAAYESEEWQRKRIAHRVNVNVRLVFEYRLNAQHQ